MNTNIFEKMAEHGYEQITFFYDKETGLKAINCIHSTELGPAGGGTRMLDYETEDAALEDALRLSRGMTYKNACAGLNIGGGKTVVIADPKQVRRDVVTEEAFFRSLGRFIETLGGRYIPGVDMNTTTEDMLLMYNETKHVMAIPGEAEGDGHTATAWGTYRAIEACCEVVFGSPSVAGKRVSVQGIGGCGWLVAKFLHDNGAELIVCDPNAERCAAAKEQFGAEVVGQDEIYDVDCDIFSPNAIGAIINDATVPRLRCRIICGAANNILEDEDRHGTAVMQRGIVCAPDFIANAGGIIFDGLNNVYGGIRAKRVMEETDKIYGRTLEVIKQAQRENRPPIAVANEMAEKRIEAIKRVERTYTGK